MRGQKAAISKDDEKIVDIMTAEDQAIVASMVKLRRLMNIQSWVVFGFALFLLFFIPLTQTAYVYYARTPEGFEKRLSGLDMPNLTDRAIRYWAATSVSEVLTMGFGDLEHKVMANKNRFTEEGWLDFIKAIANLDIRGRFRQGQWILLSAPSSTPVIVDQRVDLDGVYKWLIEVPVVMTYITHNDVRITEYKTVRLKISRVHPAKNPMGIAIQTWQIS